MLGALLCAGVCECAVSAEMDDFAHHIMPWGWNLIIFVFIVAFAIAALVLGVLSLAAAFDKLAETSQREPAPGKD